MNGKTYARARLWTGISGVGIFVVASLVALSTGAAARFFEGRGGTPASDGAWLMGGLLAVALATLPLDIMGGYVLPRRYGRPAPGLLGFLVRWLRGVVVLSLVSTLSALLLLSAGRAGGLPLALAAFAGSSLLLMALQEPLARLVGGLRRSSMEGSEAIVLQGADPGFSGGFTGLSPRAVLPERWLRELEAPAMELLLKRRAQIVESGAWRRSLLGAVLWNTLGFGLSCQLPQAGVDSLAGLVTAALGFTLWTFLGLLLLPTPSRRATLAADGALAQSAEDRERWSVAVGQLDRLQDDEPERSAGLESVFHPIPSVAGRRLALGAGRAKRPGFWHLARTALYLSHVGLSQLPRAVHCNAGRPELWVYLPSDG